MKQGLLASSLACALFWSAAPAVAQPPCGGLVRPAFTYTGSGLFLSFGDSSETHGFDVVRSWDFGDGSPVLMDSLSPAHDFPQPGSYQVCLTLTDTAQGQYCQASFCRTVRTDLLEPCPGLISPAFTTVDANVNGITLTNVSGATPDSMWWELGDGFLDTNNTVDHTYLWPGRYYVAMNCLMFDQVEQQYCQASAERWVAVDGNGATCNQQLFANFGITDLGGGSWLFDSESITTLLPVGIEVWSFGDGAIGFGPFVIHEYMDPSAPHQVCMLTAATDGIQDTCYAYVCHTLVPALTAVEEAVPSSDLRVWPVPFSTGISIAAPGATGPVELELFDAVGRLVVSVTTTLNAERADWALPTLPSGPYLLRVTTDVAVRTLPLLKE